VSFSIPQTIAQQANAIGAWISDQTSGSGATVELMANQRHLWEVIYSTATDGAPKILVVFDGETSRGSFNERNLLHRVDRSWVIVVMRGHGFDHGMAQPNKESRTAFYDDCESVRDLVRRMIDISEEPMDYVSMKPLPGVAQPNLANTFLDGYVISFTTANDLKAITDLAPGQTRE
jgi:hypothetical protein